MANTARTFKIILGPEQVTDNQCTRALEIEVPEEFSTRDLLIAAEYILRFGLRIMQKAKLTLPTTEIETICETLAKLNGVDPLDFYEIPRDCN